MALQRGGSGESGQLQGVRTPRQAALMVSEPFVKPREDTRHLFTLQAFPGLMLF